MVLSSMTIDLYQLAIMYVQIS